MMKRMIASTWAASLMLAAMPATAGQTVDLNAIDQAVANFTGAPAGMPGGAAMPVDRRLRLAPCNARLALSWYGTRHDTVQVECPVVGGWRLYVPLGSAGEGVAAASAPAITRGDSITITVAGDGFAVSQPGEAMESGAVGSWIKVRGVQAGAQPLRGKVLRPGVVGMDLP